MTQTIINLGTGGAVLNGQNGSTADADSNDALFLDWDGRNYVYLPGVNSNYLSVPDEAALDITGDIDVRVQLAMDDWTPSATQYVISKFGAAGQRSWRIGILSSGLVNITFSVDGTATNTFNSTAATNLSDNEVKWLRWTQDVNNGASGTDGRIFLSNDGVTWTQLGSTVTAAGVVSIFSSTAPVEIGSRTSGIELAPGKYYRAQIFNGIGGTKVLDVDTSVITTGAATSFTALTGQTVTINRGTSGSKSVAVVSPVWLFGTDDSMSVAINALLAFNSTVSFTAFVVARKFGRTTGNLATFIGTTNPSLGFEGFLMRENTTNDTVFVLDTNGVNVAQASVAGVTGTLAIMSFVVDRTSQTLVRRTNATTSSPSSTTAVGNVPMSSVLGIGGGAGGGFNDMELLSVSIFRRALTATEISQITAYYQARLS